MPNFSGKLVLVLSIAAFFLSLIGCPPAFAQTKLVADSVWMHQKLTSEKVKLNGNDLR